MILCVTNYLKVKITHSYVMWVSLWPSVWCWTSINKLFSTIRSVQGWLAEHKGVQSEEIWVSNNHNFYIVSDTQNHKTYFSLQYLCYRKHYKIWSQKCYALIAFQSVSCLWKSWLSYTYILTETIRVAHVGLTV